MTTLPIVESGMTFGPYPEGSCFHIEKSKAYKRIQQDVKMAEFLLLRPKEGGPMALWVVEAKQSSPRPENENDFDLFIGDVREKLINAFSLGLAVCLKRHENASAEVPESFKTLNLSTTNFRFALVINGHKEDWLDSVKYALVDKLRSTIQTWAMSTSDVVVLNEGLAKEYGLILSIA